MTFRNQSVIDYSIVSYQALHFVKMFTISDLDALFSDGHALISTTLQLQQTSAIENKTLKQAIKRRSKLPENRKFAFVENLNRSKIQELSSLINETSVNQVLICKTKINSICLQFSEIFSESAKLSICDKGDYKIGKKVWFGTQCENARKQYHSAKSKHSRNPTPCSKSNLIQASKYYKIKMNYYINKNTTKPPKLN